MFEALVDKGFNVSLNQKDELEWLNVHSIARGSRSTCDCISDHQIAQRRRRRQAYVGT
jgi:hypothetical protein